MKDVFDEAIRSHKRIVEEFGSSALPAISEITREIITCFNREGCVFLVGNGGAASSCQHIAGEFVGRFYRERESLPAVALTADSAVLTCIANDYDFKEVFARQVDGLVREKDLLWAFSTSGNSENIIAAVKSASRKNVKVIAFAGDNGSELEREADICLNAGTNQANLAQEIHLLASHIICDLVDRHYDNGEN